MSKTTPKVHRDFEGKELRLGDTVLTVDLDRKGGMIRRGEIIKLCPSAVKIRVQRVCPVHGPENPGEIIRGDNWIALVEHNPIREAELLNQASNI